MDPTTRLEGFLLKRGKVARGWKKRWFQLGDRDFSRLYYSEEKNSEKLGYIDLKVSEVRASRADSFVIEVSNADRTFQLQAANEVQFQSWYEFLRRCTREASSSTEPLHQEIKRLLRVIHELSEERRLALELTNRLNEELASVTGRFTAQLSAANTRIAVLESENAQLRRAQGLEVISVSEPLTTVPETTVATSNTNNIAVRPVRAKNTSFRASLRKSLRRTLELKRDEMRMASKQRLLDIESEVELLMEELNLLHDIDGDDADASDSEDKGDENSHNDSTNGEGHTDESTNDNSVSSDHNTSDDNSAVSEERKLKKSSSEMNLKELKHRVQSSSHQTAAIVDSLHERAATVVQQAQAEASSQHERDTAHSSDSHHTTNNNNNAHHTDSTAPDTDGASSQHSVGERPKSLDNHTTDHVPSAHSSDSEDQHSPPVSTEQHKGHKSAEFRPRIDSQAPGKEYVAARVKSARTQWLTRDSMINGHQSQPKVNKPKVPLKRMDTAPSGHSFVRGVPRATTKTPAIALNSPRGVNQPVVTPSMLEDK